MRALGLCWGTIPRAPLLAHIDAAADAGFSSISISAEQYSAARRHPVELGTRLADCGLSVDSVDPALTWLPGLEPRPGAGLLSYDVAELFDAAVALGAPWVNAAVALPGAWSEAEIVDAFGALCTRAATSGVGVLLEFVPWSAVGDLAAAARVVRESGATNAGVTFDVWHHHRGGGRIANLHQEDLALVRGIQLSDALGTPPTDPMTESISARVLPGEGVIELPALMRHVLDHAATDLVSVEVFSTELSRQPAIEVARLASEAARRVVGPS